ncbi:uncharacterized protein V1518DRAFT_413099 [Limtongia smithiae]|uniref:uncharacterized protein n=1 Tax=Limtongia smithiae TaxID=1125753 RepID=UPI0034CE1CC5
MESFSPRILRQQSLIGQRVCLRANNGRIRLFYAASLHSSTRSPAVDSTLNGKKTNSSKQKSLPDAGIQDYVLKLRSLQGSAARASAEEYDIHVLRGLGWTVAAPEPISTTTQDTTTTLPAETKKDPEEYLTALQKVFSFKSFEDAFLFMTKLAFYASHVNHHPRIYNFWGRVTIRLSSFDNKTKTAFLSKEDIKMGLEAESIESTVKSTTAASTAPATAGGTAEYDDNKLRNAIIDGVLKLPRKRIWNELPSLGSTAPESIPSFQKDMFKTKKP